MAAPEVMKTPRLSAADCAMIGSWVEDGTIDGVKWWVLDHNGFGDEGFEQVFSPKALMSSHLHKLNRPARA